MKKDKKVELQGLYTYKDKVYYIAYEPVHDAFLYKSLIIGSSIVGYSQMRILGLRIPNDFTPKVLSWFPNDAIPSDIYPELFI